MAPRPARYLLALVIALLAALALAPAAQAISLAPEPSHSPNADRIETTYWVMLAVTVGLLVVVHAALIAAVFRFRARRGTHPARLAAGRGALRPVTGVLSVIAVALFVFGILSTADVREIEPTGPGGLKAAQTAQVGVKGLSTLSTIEGTESASGEEPISGAEPTETAPLQIAAIAQQWLWRFEYPGGEPGKRTFSYGELVVPVDTTVVLNIDSTDVMHSWWVPSLGGQVQAAPGEVTQTWFKADAEGRYPGRSTVFDGTAHPAMRAWVRVVSVPEYESYVETLEADLTAAQDAVAQEAAGE